MSLEENVLLFHEKLKPNVKNERKNEEITSAEKFRKGAIFLFFYSTKFKKYVDFKFC
jgi:hypothetical protein